MPQLWGDWWGGCCLGVKRCAAGQRERCCELRRAERELCRGEQCREQRGHECECLWSRAGRERAQCCWSCERERVRVERVAQRQRACLPGRCWARQGSWCACVCRRAAGQREWSCELQRAEREFCFWQQRRDVWLHCCYCCWRWLCIVWCEFACSFWWQRCFVDCLDQREQCCVALWCGSRRRCFRCRFFWCAGRQCVACS